MIKTKLYIFFIISSTLGSIACRPTMEITQELFPSSAETAGKIAWMEFIDGDFYMELEEHKEFKKRHSAKYHSSALAAGADHAASFIEIF